MSQLRDLAEPFPHHLVKNPPRGKFGSYVPHSSVNERALAVVGPFDMEMVEIVRGWTDSVTVNKGKDNERTFPARDNAIVGVVLRISVEIDGRRVSVEEAGDVEGAAAQSDGENLKEAFSDAFKRCWMRPGLGLHLWSQDDYSLSKQLDAPHTDTGTQLSPDELAQRGTNRLKREALDLMGDEDEAKAIWAQALATVNLEPDAVVPVDLHEKVRDAIREMGPT